MLKIMLKFNAVRRSPTFDIESTGELEFLGAMSENKVWFERYRGGQ